MDVNEVVSLVCCFWKRGRDAGRKNVHGMEVEWRRLDDESCCKCFWIDEDGNFGSWFVKPTHKEHISCQEQTSVEESVTYRYPWSGSVYRRSSVFRHLPPVLLGIQWSWIGCWWVKFFGALWMCVVCHGTYSGGSSVSDGWSDELFIVRIASVIIIQAHFILLKFHDILHVGPDFQSLSWFIYTKGHFMCWF